MILVVSLRFSPFATEDTYEDVFHAPDGDVQVPFMHQQTFAQYGEQDGMRFIQKGYRGGRLTMMLAVPRSGKLSSALAKLKEHGMKSFLFVRNPVSVKLSLPKVDCSFDAGMVQAITAAGCWVPFSAKYADYSGISEEPLVITDVSQRLRVQIDEGGTKAAAATIVEGVPCCARFFDEYKQVILNRPFVYAIIETDTGLPVFLGTVDSIE